MSSHCESHARMKSPEDGCPVCLTAKLQEAVGIAQKFAEAARDACIAGLAQSAKLRQAEVRIAELEAELLGAMREKEDVRRTATEDALRWAWNEYINSNFVIDPNGFIERGLLDLLVEK